MKYLMLIVFAYALNGVAFLVLVFRIGRPRHAVLSFAVWLFSWIPLLIAGWIAGEEVLTSNSTTQDLLRAYWPQLLLLLLLLAIGYLLIRHRVKKNRARSTRSEPRDC